MLCRMSSNYGAKSTAIIFGILMITMVTAPIWGGWAHTISRLLRVPQILTPPFPEILAALS